MLVVRVSSVEEVEVSTIENFVRREIWGITGTSLSDSNMLLITSEDIHQIL